MTRLGLTPASVVAAGLDLADEAGLAAVTLSELGRRLGAKVPSLYAHVGGSGDLASRLCAASLDELAQAVCEAVAGQARGDAVAALAQTYRTWASLHPGRWQAARALADPTPEVLAAGRRHSTLTRAVLRGYDLEEPDVTHAVRMLGSVVTGWVDSEQRGAFAHSEPGAESSWRWTLGCLDLAFSHPSTPSAFPQAG